MVVHKATEASDRKRCSLLRLFSIILSPLLFKLLPRLVDSQFFINAKLQVITSFTIFEKLRDG
nr:MAG TPA: hypothetical protein [Caudoviricetes sp.]